MRLYAVLAVAGLALAAAPAFAFAAPPVSSAAAAAKVDAAIGNTIVETYPDGRVAEIWLQRGGAYTGEGRRRDMSSGHWSVQGSQLCFRQAHPFVFGARFCTPIPDVGMGQPWQAKAPTGETITVKVVSGHIAPK